MKIPRNLLARAKRPKYRNTKTTVGGITFDSAKEAARWGELCLMERAGKISKLERQVPFPIEINGVKVCKYVCDFSYVREGVRIVEDVKSAFTRKLPVYRLKKKLVEASFLGVKITEC